MGTRTDDGKAEMDLARKVDQRPLIGVSADWVSVWGTILWVLTLVMMSTIGSVHPAMRRGQQEDPGPAATRLGAMTPVGSLMGQLVYGALLGLLYQTWPLA